MGSSESKIKSNDGKDIPSNESSSPSTPMKCTDINSENFSHLDPRSPSEDIYRTPIEIPKENDDKAIPPLKHLIDPRSPTDQFDRTPIVIKESQSHIPKKLHNKILDNARRNITYSPTQTPKSKTQADSQTVISPPKLISSVPSFKKCNEKRKSFVGLLETNIDFTETNLDDIVKNKSLDKSLSININETSLCEIVERKNCDPRSPSKDFLRTPIQIVQKVGEVEINPVVNNCEELKCKDFEEYQGSDSLLKLANDKDVIESEKDLENDEIEALKINEQIPGKTELTRDENAEVAREEACQLDTPEKKKIDITDDTEQQCSKEIHKVGETEQMMAEIVDDLVGTISTLALEGNVEDRDTSAPIIDLTADVQEFDKKLTKIIHENNENFSFKKIVAKEYLTDVPKKRTPMKDINQISETRKNKLKVSDKPRKLNYDISKIPVFRDRNGIKTRVQCENTPPSDTKLRKRRASQPKWDSDKTLVI